MSGLNVIPACQNDVAHLGALIERSVRQLSKDYHTPAVLESALKHVFGVDTQLIKDQTYLKVVDASGEIVGCGGWSYRKTLFGSDAVRVRDPLELDPEMEQAKIRAFFVDPEHARRGIGTLILNRCERDAIARGFKRAELMSTMAGVKFYGARGYDTEGQSALEYQLGGEQEETITFVPMSKKLLTD